MSGPGGQGLWDGEIAQQSLPVPQLSVLRWAKMEHVIAVLEPIGRAGARLDGGLEII